VDETVGVIEDLQGQVHLMTLQLDTMDKKVRESEANAVNAAAQQEQIQTLEQQVETLVILLTRNKNLAEK
jgi:hypothetical protein